MKSLAASCLGSLLICIGCGSAKADESTVFAAGPKANSAIDGAHSGARKESPEEKEYRERFVVISSKLDSIPHPTQGGDPAKFLAELKAKQEKEREVIDELGAVKAPAKFKEFHQTILEWKKERWALDEEGIQYLTENQQDKLEELSSRIDRVQEKFNQQISDIVKSHGYKSTDSFLGVK